MFCTPYSLSIYCSIGYVKSGLPPYYYSELHLPQNIYYLFGCNIRGRIVTNGLSLIKAKPDTDVIVVCIPTCGRNQSVCVDSNRNPYITSLLYHFTTAVYYKVAADNDSSDVYSNTQDTVFHTRFPVISISYSSQKSIIQPRGNSEKPNELAGEQFWLATWNI